MDALLLGRTTYEIFANSWPTAPEMPFTRLLNAVPKYIASRTLAGPLAWLRLWRYPLLLGRGKRVFAEGTVPTALRLTDSVTYLDGTLQLAYETAGAPTYGNLAVDE